MSPSAGDCRCCALASNYRKNLFEDDSVPTKLVLLASFPVIRNDDLPQQICHDCINELDIYWAFREQIIKIDNDSKHLLNWMSTNINISTNTSKKCTAVDIIPVIPSNKCRCCMLPVKNLNNLFNDKSIQAKIRLLTNIHVKRYDKLPQNICRKCIIKLYEYFEFWRNLKNRHRMLYRLKNYNENDVNTSANNTRVQYSAVSNSADKELPRIQIEEVELKSEIKIEDTEVKVVDAVLPVYKKINCKPKASTVLKKCNQVNKINQSEKIIQSKKIIQCKKVIRIKKIIHTNNVNQSKKIIQRRKIGECKKINENHCKKIIQSENIDQSKKINQCKKVVKMRMTEEIPNFPENILRTMKKYSKKQVQDENKICKIEHKTDLEENNELKDDVIDKEEDDSLLENNSIDEWNESTSQIDLTHSSDSEKLKINCVLNFDFDSMKYNSNENSTEEKIAEVSIYKQDFYEILCEECGEIVYSHSWHFHRRRHKLCNSAAVKKRNEKKRLKNKRTYVCEICGAIYVAKYRAQHMSTHDIELKRKLEKRYPCTTCDRSFRSRLFLVEHMHTHTGAKPYVCTYCKRGFNRRESLRVHTRLHTDERPFKCPICPKAFRHNVTKKKHLADYHDLCSNEIK